MEHHISRAANMPVKEMISCYRITNHLIFFFTYMFRLKDPISLMCLFECFVNNLPLFCTTEKLFKAISSATLPSEHFLSSCPAQPIALIL